MGGKGRVCFLAWAQNIRLLLKERDIFTSLSPNPASTCSLSSPSKSGDVVLISQSPCFTSGQGCCSLRAGLQALCSLFLLLPVGHTAGGCVMSHRCMDRSLREEHRRESLFLCPRWSGRAHGEEALELHFTG